MILMTIIMSMYVCVYVLVNWLFKLTSFKRELIAGAYPGGVSRIWGLCSQILMNRLRIFKMIALIKCLTAILESIDLTLVGRAFNYPTQNCTVHVADVGYSQQSQSHTPAFICLTKLNCGK